MSVSCGKDEPNTGEEPPIVNNQKIILNPLTKEPEKQSNISSVDVDSNKLVLNFTNTNMPSYNVGDILIGKTKEGYIRKIESVIKDGNRLHLTTSNATIEEAFKKFEIDTSFTFYPEVQQLVSMNESSEVVIGDKKYNLSIQYSTPQVHTKGILDYLPLSFDNVKLKLESPDKRSKMEIAIENISLLFKIKADQLKANIFPLKFSLVYDVNSTIELKNITMVIKGGIDGTYPIKDDLLTKDYPIGIILVGGIPFNFSLNIGLGLQAEFMVGVGTEMNGSYKYTDNYKVGAEYNILGWTPVWEKSSSQVGPAFSFAPVERMTGEAKIYLKPKLKVKLADMIGPSLFVKGFIYDEMSYPPIKVEVGYGLEGGVDFIVNAFGKNIANFKTILASKKWPQYSYTNHEPTIPVVVSPINNADNISLMPSLVWDCTDADSEEILYDVIFSTSTPPIDIVSSKQKGKTFSKTGLSKNTKYYWQIKATDTRGAFSSSPIWSFTTELSDSPTVITTNPSEIKLSSAKVGGNVTSDGGSNITDRGIYYSTNIISNGTKLQIGSGIGAFSATLSSLTPNTTYYVKAYATNTAGTSYGSILNFKTDVTAQSPTVTTTAPSNITSNNATLGGNVTSEGSSAVLERGVVYATTQNPTISNTKIASGSGTGAYSVNATNLTTNSIYYVRAYATNSHSTAYGNEVNFSTIPSGVTPVAAFTASSTSINLGQTIQFTDQSTGNPTSWSWDFGDGGTSTIQNPSYTYTKSGSYNVSLAVNNSTGSNSISKTNFITVTDIIGILFNPNLTYGTVTDIDGNKYKTIQIGTKVWMAENLKVTKLNDGTAISFESSNNSWMTKVNPLYCWYNNDIENKNTYGALYNRHTVNTGKLCPIGWHVSTDSNWSTLTNNTGGDNNAAIKLKEAGNGHWSGASSNSTNSSGFTALPGGIRYENGAFSGLKDNGTWWCTNPENYAFSSWYRQMFYNANDIQKYGLNFSPQLGLSVRCVKD